MTVPPATAEDLIHAHADLVYATCLRVTSNPQDAADVSQEVFISWIRQRGQIRGPLAAWLHGTARRRALDWLRRNHRRARHEGQADGPWHEAVSQDPHAGEADDAWRAQLDACLAGLDQRQRTLVIEHHVLGLSQEALATRWRLSQATISRHLAKGLGRLRRDLARRGITTATLTAIPVLLASSARGAECPGELWAPLAAQLRISGAAPLGGTGALTAWWRTWPILTVAGLAAALVLSFGAALTWRAVVAAGLPDDPLSTLVGHLPPAQRAVAVPTGPGLHRYPSIEALIARIPEVDELRQERIRRWLTRDGTSAPWAWLEIDREAHAQEARALDPVHPRDPTPAVAAADQRVIKAMATLLPELRTPGASLTEAGWLAADYRDGRIQRAGAVLALSTALADEPRYLLRALGRQALAAADPHAALLDLDAFAAALERGTYTLLRAMQARASAAERDDVYLHLAIVGRLSDTDLARWCGESPTCTSALEDGLLGEVLLVMYPRLDDVQRWGTAAQAADFIPRTDTAPGLMDWLTRPFDLRLFQEFIAWTDRVRGPLSGAGEQQTILADSLQNGGIGTMMIPALTASTGNAAQARLAHDGKRLLARLIADARRGRPLPATLDDAVQAVADGRELLGGSTRTYGLRYQRLSDTRFRIALDPTGHLPSYSDQEQLRQLVGRSGPTRPADGSLPPVAIGRATWEADVARLAEPSVQLAPIDAGPPFTSANQ